MPADKPIPALAEPAAPQTMPQVVADLLRVITEADLAAIQFEIKRKAEQVRKYYDELQPAAPSQPSELFDLLKEICRNAYACSYQQNTFPGDSDPCDKCANCMADKVLGVGWELSDSLAAPSQDAPLSSHQVFELAKALKINYCPDLVGEQQAWEVCAESEPKYFATFPEAVIFLVELLDKNSGAAPSSAPDWNEKEREAIAALMKSMDVSEKVVMRQALRTLQLVQNGMYELREVNPTPKMAPSSAGPPWIAGNWQACFEFLAEQIRAGDMKEAADYVKFVDDLGKLGTIAENLRPSSAGPQNVCSNEEITKRDDLLGEWCDSWNDLRLREKRDSIQAELFDKTNALWPTVWPPIEDACKNCHTAYGRGMEKADDSTHEYLDRKGATPANGRGLYLRLDELLALSQSGRPSSAGTEPPISELTKRIRKQQEGVPRTVEEVAEALEDGSAFIVGCGAAASEGTPPAKTPQTVQELHPIAEGIVDEVFNALDRDCAWNIGKEDTIRRVIKRLQKASLPKAIIAAPGASLEETENG